MSASAITRRLFVASGAAAATNLNAAQDRFLEELSRASFLFFWERANPETGLVLDRALNSDQPEKRTISSAAATGFGLTGLCIASERGWMDRGAIRQRVANTLRFYARKSPHEHGWFYHFVDAATGERVWKCELSSIDTALLLAGVLTARQYFRRDPEIPRLADEIYRRIDWRWMCNDDPRGVLTMGWKPESGFLKARWDHYCELMVLYVLGIGAPANTLPPEAWTAWTRPRVSYGGYGYVSGAPTLFTHQYSHAWIDFRGTREEPSGIDWFRNSSDATLAHRAFCIDLGKTEFAGCYDERVWGVSASDSARGYQGWGGPPRAGRLDGTVVPCAAAGSLMFHPALCVDALMAMRERFGDRVWGRYGFVDAFHPVNGWTNPDVIGIDLGITLLAAENARSGRVWDWFGRNPEVRRALRLARVRRAADKGGAALR